MQLPPPSVAIVLVFRRGLIDLASHVFVVLRVHVILQALDLL